MESQIAGDFQIHPTIQWQLLQVDNKEISAPDQRPHSKITSVIDAHRAQLNALIMNEAASIWSTSAQIEDVAFAKEKHLLVGVEPDSLMHRQSEFEVDGISPGAPTELFWLKLSRLTVEPVRGSSLGQKNEHQLRLSIDIDFLPDRAISADSSFINFKTTKFRWVQFIQRSELQPKKGINKPATQNFGSYVLGQIKLKNLIAQANESEISRSQFPILSQLNTAHLPFETLLGIYYGESSPLKFTPDIGLKLTNNQYLWLDYDWAHSRVLSEELISEADFQSKLMNHRDHQGQSWRRITVPPTIGNTEASNEQPTPIGESNESLNEQREHTSASLDLGIYYDKLLPSVDWIDSYAIVARPAHMLYSPQSARGVLNALIDEMKKIAASPPQSMRDLDFEKLILNVRHKTEIFGYQDFPGGAIALGSPIDEADRVPKWESDSNGQSPFSMGNHVPQWVVVLWRILHKKIKEIDKNGEKRILLPIYNKQDFIDPLFFFGKFDGEEIIMHPHHPAENLSWDEAQEFLEWFNEIPAIKASGCVYDLPTSTQWEYVSRFLGIEKESGQPRLSRDSVPLPAERLWQYAIYNSDPNFNRQEIGPQPIDSKKPFPGSGLRNVFGNTFVLTKDLFNPYKSQSELPDQVDPVSTSTNAAYCVVRGGAYGTDKDQMRSAYRSAVPTDSRSPSVGLRLTRRCMPVAK